MTLPKLPDPKSPEWEDMVEFMRADLANGMAYSKIIKAARESIEARGGNFDEEFKKWRESRRG